MSLFKRLGSGALSGSVVLFLYYVAWLILLASSGGGLENIEWLKLLPFSLIGAVIGAILGGVGGIIVGSIFSKNAIAPYIGGVVFALIAALAHPCAFMGGC